MNDPTNHPNPPSSNWLRLARTRYSREILLEMENGRILAGQARDFNLKGFFLIAEMATFGDQLEGMRGIFLEDLHGERVSIPCQIVRVTSNGVGIQFISESND